MKPHRKIILRLTIAVSLFLLFIGILNLIIQASDFSSYQNLLSKKIGEIIKRNVSFGGMKISLFEGLGLSLENVIIKEKDNNENFIIADRIILTPSLLPLLKKKILKLLGQKNPKRISRYKLGKFLLQGLLLLRF